MTAIDLNLAQHLSISALNRLHISLLQYSPEELSEELRDAD